MRGLSQTDLAGMANLAPGQINRYESGKNAPRPHILSKLAAALGVFPEWLASGSGDRDTGVTVAHHPLLNVSLRERFAGGADLAVDLDESVYRQLSERARLLGLQVDDYVKVLLLENLEKERVRNSSEIADKLEELKVQRASAQNLLQTAQEHASLSERVGQLAAEVMWLDHEIARFEKLIHDYFPDAVLRKNLPDH